MDGSRQGTNTAFEECLERNRVACGAVQRWMRRLQGALGKLEVPATLLDWADTQERLSRTLLSEMHRIPRGATEVSLPDYSGDGTGRVRMILDPATPVREQAERMLQQARKRRREARILPERRARVEAELLEAMDWSETLGQEPGQDRLSVRERMSRLDELEARLSPRGLWPVPPRVREAAPPRLPVRWTLPDGWILMAGRSGTENDFLTTRIARPDDLWFHVANVPGSHVVLRSPDGRATSPAPAEMVERAASLAAWLSRMRAQTSVEVRYTERKRVRKPRKAPAGTVVMDQSRSILVKPAPPPNTTGSV